MCVYKCASVLLHKIATFATEVIHLCLKIHLLVHVSLGSLNKTEAAFDFNNVMNVMNYC